MKKNTIFVSIDNNFYTLLLEFLRVIKKNYKDHPLIHIIYINLTEKQKSKAFFVNKNIKFIENSITESLIWPIMLHLNSSKYDSIVFYARFMIWNEYFRKFDKVLHLDVDMLILGPLDYIFKKDDFFIVEDIYEWHDFININDKNLKKLFKQDNISKTPKCANAWMFLVTKKYLTNKVFKEFIEIKNNYKNFIRFADQSIINIFLHKNNIKISNDYKSNFQYRLFFMKYNDKKLFNNIKILHLNWITKNYKLLFMKILKYSILFKIWIFINKASKWKISKYFFN